MASHFPPPEKAGGGASATASSTATISAGTAANKLFGGSANPCGYPLVFNKDSSAGPRERLGCRGMNPGFDSISGTDDTTLEIEIYGYIDGDMGPTERGTITIDFTWIIEAYPDDEEPPVDS